MINHFSYAKFIADYYIYKMRIVLLKSALIINAF